MKTVIQILMGATIMANVLTNNVAAENEEIKGATITVNIGPFNNDKGQFSCALHDKKDGFPMDFKVPNVQFHPIEGDHGTCVFNNVPSGIYALAVIHDRNSDHKLNTNFLGIPKEPWAVSNNVRPSLRAPKFKEARFEIIDGEHKRFDLEVRK